LQLVAERLDAFGHALLRVVLDVVQHGRLRGSIDPRSIAAARKRTVS
jgi:hypothetical protein